MEWLGLISLLGNTFLPPVYNIVKGLFSKGKVDNPEQVMSNLATTKPDILPQYVNALALNRDSETKWFNRDIAGVPSKWVVNLRGIIRPLCVIISLSVIIASFFGVKQETQVMITVNGVLGNWLGTKIDFHK